MASAAQYAEWLQGNQDKKDTPLYNRAVDAYKSARTAEISAEPKQTQNPTEDQKIRGSIPAAIAKGGLAPIHGLAEMAYQAFPEPVQRTVTAADKWLFEKTGGKLGYPKPQPEQLRSSEEAYQKAKKAVGREGFDWAQLSGNVMSPVTMAMMGANLPATLGAATIKSAGLGGLSSATMPTSGEGEFWAEKGKQLGAGTAFGAVFPLGAASGKGAWNFGKEVFSPRASVDKFLKGLAGDDIVRIKNALQTAKKGETAQQVLGRIGRQAKEQGDDVFGTKLARLEDDLSKSASTDDLLNSIYSKQQGAREKTIKSVMGSEADMAADKAARSRVTKPFYKATEESVEKVDASPVLSKVDDILAKNPNETAIVTPLSSIKEKLSGDNTPQSLYSLSKEIKRMMGSKNPAGQAEYDVKILSEIKNALDDQIGKAELAFKTAQSGYRQMSQPITERKVATEMLKRLTKSGDEDLMSSKEGVESYLSGLRDPNKMLKKSTGFKRHKNLEEAVPESAAMYREIGDQLLDTQYGKALSRMKESSLKDIDGELVLSLPHILSRPVVITNALLKHVGKKDTTPIIHKFLNESMADPKLLLKALEEPAQSATRKMAIKVLNEARNATVAVGSQKIGEQ